MTADPQQPADIVLSPRLDFAAAADLQGALEPLAATADGRLLIDGQAVETVSTACLQVLMAADRSLSRRGCQLGLTHPSATLRGALIELGLEAELARWEVRP
ncbi:MAG TPA: STAS domain-containing protein [Candidatus Sulfotelmatobacter sp.]|nr:STAS domain-containing protein [Candidatus Sulfotelmatobacter sp.]